MFKGVTDDVPTCFIGYTIKGFGLPFAGHKDNHAGLMNLEQLAQFQAEMGISSGEEWDRFSGLEVDQKVLQDFLDIVPFSQKAPLFLFIFS